MSERDWRDRKCWDCKFAVVYKTGERGDLSERKWCRRFPPTRLPREPGGPLVSGYPDVTLTAACAEFRK